MRNVVTSPSIQKNQSLSGAEGTVKSAVWKYTCSLCRAWLKRGQDGTWLSCVYLRSCWEVLVPTLSSHLMWCPGDIVSRSGLVKPTQVTGSPSGCAAFVPSDKTSPSRIAPDPISE